jgi:hypothetical protein
MKAIGDKLPSPKRVPVRLFVKWQANCDVYVSQVGPVWQGDKEIHSDNSGGWFVEVQS